MSEIKKLLKRLNELMTIPLYDVSGGKQRNSGENEEIMKIKAELRKIIDG